MRPALPSLVVICLLMLLLASCRDQAPSTQTLNQQNAQLIGTWTLKTRSTGGEETPATERQMKLIFLTGETFRAEFRGDDTQKWIRAGEGSFTYRPPELTLYWESGGIMTLLVTELASDSLFVHHGRQVVPLNNQEPDEVFVRHKPQTGPIRNPS
jgi:hypothetical protein